MELIHGYLQSRFQELVKPKIKGEKINTTWEIADEFGKYVGLETKLVLRLFKLYGKEKTLSIRGWLKDYPSDKRGKMGIAIWKLKQK